MWKELLLIVGASITTKIILDITHNMNIIEYLKGFLDSNRTVSSALIEKYKDL